MAVKPIVIFPGALNVPQSHPRLLYNTPARLAQAQSWWASNSYIPVDPPGPTAFNRLALAYAMTTGATQASYLAKMTTLLFSEDPLASPGGIGAFMDWAYFGNINDATFVPVGSAAPGLPANGTPSDAFRGSAFMPLYFDLTYSQLTPTQISKYLNGWATIWNTPWGNDASNPDIFPSTGAPDVSNPPTVDVTGGGSSGGTLPAGTYIVTYSYANAGGETLIYRSGTTTAVTFTSALGNIPRVTVPSLPAHATSWSLYLTPVGGTFASLVLFSKGNVSLTFDISTDNPLTANYAVTVPSFSTILINQINNPWGGDGLNGLNGPMVGNNYFWGKINNGVSHLLAIWYEDPINAAMFYSRLLGPQSTSFWELTKVAVLSGGLQGGMPTEGPEYGRYEAQYVTMPFLSIMTMGRDLLTECSHWNDMLSYYISVVTPQPTRYGQTATTYYQFPPYFDDARDGGYPQFKQAFDTAYFSDWMTMLSIEYGAGTRGKYARQLLSLGGQPTDSFIAAIDPNSLADTQDWTLDGLPLVRRCAGPDNIAMRSSWGISQSFWYDQLNVFASGGHNHMDNGSFQGYRSSVTDSRWLTKESTGYSDRFASPRIPTVVAASPVPTATVFAGVGLPTSVTTSTVNYASSGMGVKFLTGALAGQSQNTTSISGQTLTTAAFSQAPAPGDQFVVYIPIGIVSNQSPPHNTPTVGCFGQAGTTAPYNQGPSVTLWDVSSPSDQSWEYVYWGVNLTTLYQGLDPAGHPDRNNPYTSSVYRESAVLRAMECRIFLDRVQTQTVVAGNTAFPAWDVSRIPVTFPLHTPNPMIQDGPNQAYMIEGSHALRVFTLLPPKSSGSSSSSSSKSSSSSTPFQANGAVYIPVLTTDFTGSHESDTNLYFSRLEIVDQTPGSTHYLMNIIQMRDASGDSDVSASILTQDALTWTVQITHPTKGSAWIILNKGLIATQGEVQVPLAFSFTDTSYPYADAPQCFFNDTATSIVVGSSSGNLYRYSEATGTWSQLSMTGGPGIALHFVIDTETAGKWCFGTATGAAGSVYQYDTATGTVTLSNAPAANQGYNTAVHIVGLYTLVFRGFQGDVYKTTDGVTFSLLSSPAAEAIFSSVLTTGGVVWMGGEAATQTPFKSTDNGTTWAATNDGTMSNNMLGITQGTNGDILCSKTRAGGVSISRISATTGLVTSSSSGIPNFSTVGQILGLGAKRIACVVAGSQPYISSDDGLTWAVWGNGISAGSSGGHLGKTAKNVYYHSGTTVYKSPNLA